MRTNDRRPAGTGSPRVRAGASAAGLAALVVAGAAAAGLLVLRLGTLLPAEPRTAGVDRWVELGVVAGGAVAAAWLTLSALLALACVAATRLGRSWRAGEAALRRIAPGAVQRMARTAVGVGVGAGLVLVPAAAHATPGVDELPAPPGPTVPLDLGWQPTSHVVEAVDAAVAPAEAPAGVGTDAGPDDVAIAALEPAAPVERDDVERTSSTTAAPTSVEERRPHRGADEGTVVVHRGDTLWAIAAATLDDDATDAEIMRAVVHWHEANRDVIGDDPDLILPGQVLHAPA
jgi:nucleoid-associated protein YgaU